jgi:hypothetical protein
VTTPTKEQVIAAVEAEINPSTPGKMRIKPVALIALRLMSASAVCRGRIRKGCFGWSSRCGKQSNAATIPASPMMPRYATTDAAQTWPTSEHSAWGAPGPNRRDGNRQNGASGSVGASPRGPLPADQHSPAGRWWRMAPEPAPWWRRAAAPEGSWRRWAATPPRRKTDEPGNRQKSYLTQVCPEVECRRAAVSHS